MGLIWLWILFCASSVLGHAPLYRKRSVFDDNPGPRLPHNVDVHLYEIEIQPFIEAEGVEIPPGNFFHEICLLT